MEGHFIYEIGIDPPIRHRPKLDMTEEEMSDDNLVAAYSIARISNGDGEPFWSVEVMRRAEVLKVRQMSQTGALGKTDRQGKAIPPKGPWVDWQPEMWKKSVLRRHTKVLPMSGDILDTLERDAAEEARAEGAARLLSVEPDAPRALPPTREDIALANGADPDTGEIARDDEDEETARALDRQSEAAMERRDDYEEGPSDEQRGEQHNDTDQSPADDLIARIEAAAIIGDVIGIEQSYQNGGREMFETPDQDRIETAIADAKARLKGGK